jgi:hypothetical protein
MNQSAERKQSYFYPEFFRFIGGNFRSTNRDGTSEEVRSASCEVYGKFVKTDPVGKPLEADGKYITDSKKNEAWGERPMLIFRLEWSKNPAHKSIQNRSGDVMLSIRGDINMPTVARTSERTTKEGGRETKSQVTSNFTDLTKLGQLPNKIEKIVVSAFAELGNPVADEKIRTIMDNYARILTPRGEEVNKDPLAQAKTAAPDTTFG